MNEPKTPSRTREFRLKGSERARILIKKFSATEKAAFFGLVVIALISALVLARMTNQFFLVTVPANGGSLTEGEIGVPRAANPILASTDSEKDLVALVYAGLLRRDVSGNLVPDLAADYSVSPDGLTYTFDLKSGIRFDDGTPITADDVIFTISKTQNPALKSPHRADWTDVAVKKISATEVQFILKHPYAPFLQNTTLGILPQHIWKSISDDQFIFSPYNMIPVGDGPYKVANVSKDGNGVPQSYTLTPSATYVGARPHISTIILAFYPNSSRAFDALEAGVIDSLSGLNPADAATLSSTTQTEHVLSASLPRLFGVFFNQNQNPVFADKAVRQALSLVVDRQAIVDRVLNGYGTAIGSPIPTGTLASSSPVAAPNIPLATSTLQKAGWKIGSNGIYTKTVNKKTQTLAFSIMTADSPDLKAAANMVADTWRSIGAKVTVNVFEYGDLENAIAARSYDSLLFGEYVGDGLDLYAFWHSSQRNSPGGNLAEYVSNAADKVLSDARIATSSSRKQNDLSTFQNLFNQDVPAVFLYSPDFIYALPDTVKGANIGSISSASDRWNGVSDWYIDTDRIWPIFAKFNI